MGPSASYNLVNRALNEARRELGTGNESPSRMRRIWHVVNPLFHRKTTVNPQYEEACFLRAAAGLWWGISQDTFKSVYAENHSQYTSEHLLEVLQELFKATSAYEGFYWASTQELICFVRIYLKGTSEHPSFWIKAYHDLQALRSHERVHFNTPEELQALLERAAVMKDQPWLLKDRERLRLFMRLPKEVVNQLQGLTQTEWRFLLDKTKNITEPPFLAVLGRAWFFIKRSRTFDERLLIYLRRLSRNQMRLAHQAVRDSNMQMILDQLLALPRIYQQIQGILSASPDENYRLFQNAYASSIREIDIELAALFNGRLSNVAQFILKTGWLDEQEVGALKKEASQLQFQQRCQDEELLLGALEYLVGKPEAVRRLLRPLVDQWLPTCTKECFFEALEALSALPKTWHDAAPKLLLASPKWALSLSQFSEEQLPFSTLAFNMEGDSDDMVTILQALRNFTVEQLGWIKKGFSAHGCPHSLDDFFEEMESYSQCMSQEDFELLNPFRQSAYIDHLDDAFREEFTILEGKDILPQLQRHLADRLLDPEMVLWARAANRLLDPEMALSTTDQERWIRDLTVDVGGVTRSVLNKAALEFPAYFKELYARKSDGLFVGHLLFLMVAHGIVLPQQAVPEDFFDKLVSIPSSLLMDREGSRCCQLDELLELYSHLYRDEWEKMANPMLDLMQIFEFENAAEVENYLRERGVEFYFHVALGLSVDGQAIPKKVKRALLEKIPLSPRLASALTYSRECPLLRNHLEEWISRSSEGLLEQFVQAATGSSNLALGEKIRIETFQPEEQALVLATSATCSSLLRLPFITDQRGPVLYRTWEGERDFRQYAAFESWLNQMLPYMQEGFGKV